MTSSADLKLTPELGKIVNHDDLGSSELSVGDRVLSGGCG